MATFRNILVTNHMPPPTLLAEIQEFAAKNAEHLVNPDVIEAALQCCGWFFCLQQKKPAKLVTLVVFIEGGKLSVRPADNADLILNTMFN